MHAKSLSILLVGLGKVGMTYDLNRPSNQVLTHARAISSWSEMNSMAINIVGVDPNPYTQKQFKEIFHSGEWLPSTELLELNRNFDLAIVATPIATIAKDTLSLSERVSIDKFVIEKPAAKSLAELEKLISLSKTQAKCIVGFPRPSLPSSIYLRDRIKFFGDDKNWKVDIYYGGSVLNILSHFLNLVEFLLGPFKLESFQINSGGCLSAVFKSISGNLIIHTYQNSKCNEETNEIHIQGPINISYTNSGRKIRIEDAGEQSNLSLKGIDYEQEVSQMIGNFGNKYLFWADLGVECHFTNLTSSSLLETIRLAEALDVR